MCGVCVGGIGLVGVNGWVEKINGQVSRMDKWSMSKGGSEVVIAVCSSR